MPTVADFEQRARDFVAAFDAQDPSALARLNQHYRRAFDFDDLGAEIWRRVYAFRQRSSREPRRYLLLDEAKTLVAQDAGYQSWAALVDGVNTGISGVPAFVVDRGHRGISPARQLDDHDWDALVGAMAEQRLTALESAGMMTDAALARIARLPHVTSLTLAGSRQVTDAGLAHLADMPQLQHLDLSGVKLTDAGLAVLGSLPNLLTFELNWQRGVTDAGVSRLSTCHQLERVSLMGSPVGDGVMRALRGKPRLREFKSGRLVTDEGLRALHEFPLLKDGDSAHLLIDGPFTDAGLASLTGLAGLAALDLFWNCTAITAAGFAHLAQLPNLTSLGADGALSDDAAMGHIARMPRLRTLRAQESTATDAGFEALSRSRTLESLWGRECRHFGSRGFVALSKIPTLGELGIGCGRVSDEALAAFADFPALTSLTPIGVTDHGFRHIARCQRLKRLSCMYCRTTTDAATAHIAHLPLSDYYAGLTRITDRSLEILGRMTTLQQIEFYEISGITDAGMVFLAGLPNLRDVSVASSPGVTLQGTAVFRPHVRVRYST